MAWTLFLHLLALHLWILSPSKIDPPLLLPHQSSQLPVALAEIIVHPTVYRCSMSICLQNPFYRFLPHLNLNPYLGESF
jgi:hypothetical protein